MFVEHVRELYTISKRIEEFRQLLNLNRNNVNIVNNLIINSNSLGEKRKLETELGILEYYNCKIQEKIRHLEFKHGHGLASTSRQNVASTNDSENIAWVKVS